MPEFKLTWRNLNNWTCIKTHHETLFSWTAFTDFYDKWHKQMVNMLVTLMHFVGKASRITCLFVTIAALLAAAWRLGAFWRCHLVVALLHTAAYMQSRDADSKTRIKMKQCIPLWESEEIRHDMLSVSLCFFLSSQVCCFSSMLCTAQHSFMPNPNFMLQNKHGSVVLLISIDQIHYHLLSALAVKLEAWSFAHRRSGNQRPSSRSQLLSVRDIVVSGDGREGEVISGRNDSAVQAPEFFSSILQRRVS